MSSEMRRRALAPYESQTFRITYEEKLNNRWRKTFIDLDGYGEVIEFLELFSNSPYVRNIRWVRIQ
jgi:hypothetical protein